MFTKARPFPVMKSATETWFSKRVSSSYWRIGKEAVKKTSNCAVLARGKQELIIIYRNRPERVRLRRELP